MGVQQQQGGVLKPKPQKPVSEARRIRKPLMERKRRERINTSLNDLAALLTEARMVRPDSGGRPAKLEKADILELTVKHIRSLKEKGRSGDLSMETKEAVKEEEEEEEEEVVKRKEGKEGRYLAGFRRCMNLVEETLKDAGKETLKERLLDHLGACLVNLQPPKQARNEDIDSAIKSEDSATNAEESASVCEGATASQGTCLTLKPTRLPTGVLAFVVQGPLDPALLLPSSRPQSPHTPSRPQSPEDVAHPHSPSSTPSSSKTMQSSTHEVSTSTHDIPAYQNATHTHLETLYLTPSSHTHAPPTPPPSVSPFPSHQVEEVEEMEVQEDEKEEGEVHDATEPFDLSLRRMWRPW